MPALSYQQAGVSLQGSCRKSQSTKSVHNGPWRTCSRSTAPSPTLCWNVNNLSSLQGGFGAQSRATRICQLPNGTGRVAVGARRCRPHHMLAIMETARVAVKGVLQDHLDLRAGDRGRTMTVLRRNRRRMVTISRRCEGSQKF